mgnify:CR=1 FL=1
MDEEQNDLWLEEESEENAEEIPEGNGCSGND